MKKYLKIPAALLLAAVLVLCLSACGKDTEEKKADATAVPDTIIGTWALDANALFISTVTAKVPDAAVATVEQAKAKMAEVSEMSTDDVDAMLASISGTLVFNSDGTFVIDLKESGESLHADGTYSTAGNVLRFIPDPETSPGISFDNTTWKLENGRLYIIAELGSLVFDRVPYTGEAEKAVPAAETAAAPAAEAETVTGPDTVTGRWNLDMEAYVIESARMETGDAGISTLDEAAAKMVGDYFVTPEDFIAYARSGFMVLEFKADGTYTPDAAEGDYTMHVKGTYRTEGNVLNAAADPGFSSDMDFVDAAWRFEDGRLYITMDGGTMIYDRAL